MSTITTSAGKETTTDQKVSGNESQSPAVKHLINQAMRFLRPDRPTEQKKVEGNVLDVSLDALCNEQSSSSAQEASPSAHHEQRVATQ